MAKVGRPPKFKSVEEIEAKIEEYKKHLDIDNKPPTIAGLAYYLGIDRNTLYNYSAKDEFFSTIKRAKAKVEEDIENWILTNKYNPAAWIFNLKNNFWRKDKIETENNTTMNWEITIKLPEIE